jgi:hypothetical protein
MSGNVWVVHRVVEQEGQCSPVAVVVVIVIASQSSQAAQADGVGEKDLGPSIYPHL